jgi:hypothetical protein
VKPLPSVSPALPLGSKTRSGRRLEERSKRTLAIYCPAVEALAMRDAPASNVLEFSPGEPAATVVDGGGPLGAAWTSRRSHEAGNGGAGPAEVEMIPTAGLVAAVNHDVGTVCEPPIETGAAPSIE